MLYDANSKRLFNEIFLGLVHLMITSLVYIFPKISLLALVKQAEIISHRCHSIATLTSQGEEMSV